MAESYHSTNGAPICVVTRCKLATKRTMLRAHAHNTHATMRINKLVQAGSGAQQMIMIKLCQDELIGHMQDGK